MNDTDMTNETRPDTYKGNVWVRGFQMLVFVILFGLAETLLGLAALLQFGWLLFTGHRSEMIADVGKDLGNWMKDVVAFQTGNSETKPFPWDKSTQ